jgi:hypothetical protein
MRANLADVPLSAGTWNATVPLQQSTSTDPIPDSAPLRLPKVEAGINGLLPTSWAPPIYSVSLLSKLRFALGGNGLLRQAAARSFLAQSCKRKNRPNQQKKTVRGLDNVGFIAASRLTSLGGRITLVSVFSLQQRCAFLTALYAVRRHDSLGVRSSIDNDDDDDDDC